jgi:ABC-type metal ion transport system substrate-binding protein
MSNWSYLKVLQQESANNVNYINLEVFKNSDVDTNAIKNVLRLFSSTVFKDLMK